MTTEPTEPNATESKTSPKRRFKKSATKRHFIQLSIHAVDQLITLNTKSPTALTVLLLMASKCNHLNTLFVLHADLATLLNVHIRTVTEAIKILEAGDWITRPAPHTYQLNAAAFWTAERAMIRNAPHYASITPKPKTDTLTHIPHLTPKTQPKPRNETTVFERFAAT